MVTTVRSSNLLTIAGTPGTAMVDARSNAAGANGGPSATSGAALPDWPTTWRTVAASAGPRAWWISKSNPFILIRSSTRTRATSTGTCRASGAGSGCTKAGGSVGAAGAASSTMVEQAVRPAVNSVAPSSATAPRVAHRRKAGRFGSVGMKCSRRRTGDAST
jgi:hypothetical protein